MQRGLTLVATRAETVRAALELGGRTRVFAQGPAVAGLALPMHDSRDPEYAAAGLPTLAELFGEAMALGVEVIACQSGLALMRISADKLDARMTYDGTISLLRSIGEDRLAVL